jgi:drug/metabolite transporter (DMT)-like permease
MDAASFTAIRVASGAALLVLLARGARGGSWSGAGWLSLYAVAFSFAYRDLTVATGALLLFASVQLTMLLSAVRSGERPPPLEWAGIGLAFSGLVVLVLPGLSAPPPFAALLMAAAGVAWGLYSLHGRGRRNALADTAGNFVRSVPVCALVWLVAVAVPGEARAEPGAIGASGILLAVTSGAVTSGLGYVLWYAALPGLSATRAAVVQTLVPILAAALGWLFLRETPTLRLGLASVLTLGGILLAVAARRPAAAMPPGAASSSTPGAAPKSAPPSASPSTPSSAPPASGNRRR